MPELPEVETIVRDLQRLITGATIRSVKVVRDDLIVGSPRSFELALAGGRIQDVSRRAKNIIVALDDVSPDAGRLIINLGMTGRVSVQAPEEDNPPHMGVSIALADGRQLVYQDARRFGRLEVLSAEAWNTRGSQLGIEPLSEAFTSDVLYQLTRRSRVATKTWLMDQRRVVGVGNIYASEALFRAGINPRKAARRLVRREADRLHQAIGEVLHEAIEFRGTTLLDYRDAAGQPGGFSQRLRVYDRAAEPCVRCGTPIRRIVQGGRSTFYCPSCQR